MDGSAVDQPEDSKVKTKPESSGDQRQQHSTDYAPYPKLDPADVAPPSPVDTSRSAPAFDNQATAMPPESNPYVTPAPAAASSTAKIKDVLGRWGKKMGEAAKKTEDLAGNVWQHLKTGPSLADAAMGRIAQGTKVLAEGGYEKIFRQTFETLPDEQLKKVICLLLVNIGWSGDGNFISLYCKTCILQ